MREEERRVLRREEEPDDARGLDDSDSGGVLLCCGGELAPGVEVLRVSQPDLAECGRLQRLCLREGEGDAVEVGAEERVELRGERALLGKERRGWGSADRLERRAGGAALPPELARRLLLELGALRWERRERPALQSEGYPRPDAETTRDYPRLSEITRD